MCLSSEPCVLTAARAAAMLLLKPRRRAREPASLTAGGGYFHFSIHRIAKSERSNFT